MMFRPATAGPLLELAEVLLRGESTLGRGERELIAAYVSSLNECVFCEASHSVFAALQLDGGMALVDEAKRDPAAALVSAKLRALMAIAAKVRRDGRLVTAEDVGAARAEGATDVEIHDAVLIAAAFSMYNRYVDGLATLVPDDPAPTRRWAGGSSSAATRARRRPPPVEREAPVGAVPARYSPAGSCQRPKSTRRRCRNISQAPEPGGAPHDALRRRVAPRRSRRRQAWSSAGTNFDTSTMESTGTLARRAAATIASGEGASYRQYERLPVGREEREQPADSLVGVDVLDQPDVVGRQVELLGECALDHVERHRPMVNPSATA